MQNTWAGNIEYNFRTLLIIHKQLVDGFFSIFKPTFISRVPVALNLIYSQVGKKNKPRTSLAVLFLPFFFLRCVVVQCVRTWAHLFLVYAGVYIIFLIYFYFGLFLVVRTQRVFSDLYDREK